jgi:hypothetical protein
MQTRQLIAGDTLLLEEEKSFCLVVDGLVQVFVKSPPRLSQSDDEDEEWEGGQGYQLLTEAKNGGNYHHYAIIDDSTLVQFIFYLGIVHGGY